MQQGNCFHSNVIHEKSWNSNINYERRNHLVPRRNSRNHCNFELIFSLIDIILQLDSRVFLTIFFLFPLWWIVYISYKNFFLFFISFFPRFHPLWQELKSFYFYVIILRIFCFNSAIIDIRKRM